MFDWLFGKPKFRFYEDSYARTRKNAVAGIQRAIETRKASNDAFLLVAHFPELFEEIQRALHSWQLNYEIVNKITSPDGVARHFSNTNHRILLAISSLLIQEDKVYSEVDNGRKICVIGSERHPHLKYDSALENFCRAIPSSVELGYFLSFEDAVIKSLVNAASLRILDMFGMGENELITSNMITRRLRTVLKQNAKSYVSDLNADSASEWIQLNSSQNKDSNSE